MKSKGKTGESEGGEKNGTARPMPSQTVGNMVCLKKALKRMGGHSMIIKKQFWP